MAHNTPPDRLIETAKPFFLWQAVFLYFSPFNVFSYSRFQTRPLTWHHYLDLPGHLTEINQLNRAESHLFKHL